MLCFSSLVIFLNLLHLHRIKYNLLKHKGNINLKDFDNGKSI